MAEPRVFMTPPELGKRWGVGSPKITELIKAEILIGFDVSSPGSKMPRYRILLTEIERYEKSCLRNKPPKANCPKRRSSAKSAEFV